MIFLFTNGDTENKARLEGENDGIYTKSKNALYSSANKCDNHKGSAAIFPK